MTPQDRVRKNCPACGAGGRAVSGVTISALVVDDVQVKLTPGCEVVYFRGADRVVDDEITVPVFQKQDSPGRTVCYCFAHTERDIVESSLAEDSVLDSVMQACRDGLDRCESTSPY